MQTTTAPVAPLDKRDYAIREIVETEKNYLNALTMILKRFFRPLSDVMAEEDHKVIFFGIEVLFL